MVVRFLVHDVHITFKLLQLNKQTSTQQLYWSILPKPSRIVRTRDDQVRNIKVPS